LFTCSKDKTIKVWEIPKTWIKENIGEESKQQVLEAVWEDSEEDLEHSHDVFRQQPEK